MELFIYLTFILFATFTIIYQVSPFKKEPHFKSVLQSIQENVSLEAQNMSTKLKHGLINI